MEILTYGITDIQKTLQKSSVRKELSLERGWKELQISQYFNILEINTKFITIIIVIYIIFDMDRI